MVIFLEHPTRAAGAKLQRARLMEEGVKLHTKGRHFCGRNSDVDGDVFLFKGEGRGVGVVKLLEPMNPQLNYYEYEILDRGQKCAIGIGVGEQSYPLDRMPGWNRNAIGYHADDGRLFHQDGYGRAFGPTCSVGDRMGCGVDFDSAQDHCYVRVFFTKNGKQVGDSERFKRPVHGIYPLVGLHSRGEQVRYLGHWRRVPDPITSPMELDRSPSSMWLRSNGVSFKGEDGCTLEYAGDGLDKQDVGIAQANFCLDRTNHYFEMEILSCGREGWLAIGLAKTTYPLHRHPGWNKGSIGYHADNGHLYKEKGHGEVFGPTCTEGDRMGCGVRFSLLEDPACTSSDSDSDMDIPAEFGNVCGREGSEDDDSYEENLFDDISFSDEEFGAAALVPFRLGKRLSERPYRSMAHRRVEEKTCVVYFTKNGETVGEAECQVPRGGFYPVVAMLSRGEKLKVNLKPLSG